MQAHLRAGLGGDGEDQFLAVLGHLNRHRLGSCGQAHQLHGGFARKLHLVRQGHLHLGGIALRGLGQRHTAGDEMVLNFERCQLRAHIGAAALHAAGAQHGDLVELNLRAAIGAEVVCHFIAARRDVDR